MGEDASGYVVLEAANNRVTDVAKLNFVAFCRIVATGAMALSF
jgi:hypothetical protein